MHNTTNVGLRRTIQNNNVISSTTTRKKTTQRKRRNNGRTTTTGRVDVSRVRFKRICSKGKTNSPTIIYFSTLQKFHKCTLTHTQQPNNHSPSTTLICLVLKKLSLQFQVIPYLLILSHNIKYPLQWSCHIIGITVCQ